VGTGFHPELTGRENIFLNGAVLGMTKVEIARKFDEIVSFAEIEKFIDTPVKRYSSGMYVRLAFAVAAHLEPEILILDEVLAVGDSQFQKKCLGKMGEVGKEGRTVLFVSHNMAAISKLCQRALLLSEGQCIAIGDASEVVGAYARDSEVASVSYVDLRRVPRWHDNRERIITSISLHRIDGTESTKFETGEDMVIKIGYEIGRSLPAYCAIHVLNYVGDIVMSVRSTHALESFVISGRGHIECVLPDIRLLSGEYTIRLALGRVIPAEDWLDGIPEVVRFRVNIGNYLGGMEWVNGPGHGALAQKSQWRIHQE
jgi:lipopolysaccharide transport system ATP-binding protein